LQSNIPSKNVLWCKKHPRKSEGGGVHRIWNTRRRASETWAPLNTMSEIKKKPIRRGKQGKRQDEQRGWKKVQKKKKKNRCVAQKRPHANEEKKPRDEWGPAGKGVGGEGEAEKPKKPKAKNDSQKNSITNSKIIARKSRAQPGLFRLARQGSTRKGKVEQSMSNRYTFKTCGVDPY